jgi:hypothetical protein
MFFDTRPSKERADLQCLRSDLINVLPKRLARDRVLARDDKSVDTASLLHSGHGH